MKVNDKIGINPSFWGDKPLADFLAYFKGKAPEKKLKELHKECKAMIKNKTPSSQ